MARSTGVVLTATGIAFGSEWIQTNKPNYRIPIAGLGVALIFDGVERLNERAGVGLAYIMLITVMVTPINGKSPAKAALDFLNPPKVLAARNKPSLPGPNPRAPR